VCILQDPLTQYMVDHGIPVEPDVTRPERTSVFSFPMRSPEGALCRADLTAIQQLELWLSYQRHWCEHKPSVTISVKESEWMEVGAWVWKHFDEASGISFLPMSEHTYVQAPYQDCDAATYDNVAAAMPHAFSWQGLQDYELLHLAGTAEAEAAARSGSSNTRRGRGGAEWNVSQLVGLISQGWAHV
jgi:ribonucleoside-diphosphate reductase alpha chain